MFYIFGKVIDRASNRGGTFRITHWIRTAGKRIWVLHEPLAELVESDNVVTDEFCSNEEYLIEDQTDENSETFRFVIKDYVYSESLEAFKNKVKKDFKNAKIKLIDGFFLITGYEQLEK